MCAQRIFPSERTLERTHVRRNTEGAFQRCAVPASSFGCGCIGGRQEVEQQRVGFRGSTEYIIGEDELP